jgi:hypothetical protein
MCTRILEKIEYGQDVVEETADLGFVDAAGLMHTRSDIVISSSVSNIACTSDLNSHILLVKVKAVNLQANSLVYSPLNNS